MTKIPLTFEIKVAVIGKSSVGKTTLLNGLFCNEYGEASTMNPRVGTTAAVNMFRIFSKRSSSNASSNSPMDGGSASSSIEWSMLAPDSPRSAESTLKEITKDNEVLRQSNTNGGDEVVEKTFEIELESDLVEMRKDTRLVFVDIPGINANSNKFKDYVDNNWNTFDCVILVMDGRPGLCTEEQVDLLKSAKNNLTKKNIPILILCNKIDDPAEEGDAVAEARCQVESIFAAPDREAALQQVLGNTNGSSSMTDDRDGKFPIFLPISALNGFIFRCASKMSLDEFNNFDKAMVDRLGRDRIGRVLWRKMSPGKRLKKAHEVVVDPEGYKEALEESNFDKLFLVLAYTIGGHDTQRALIEKQIQVSLDAVSPSDGIVSHLRSAYTKTQALSNTTTASGDQSESFGDASVKATFWRVYKECEDSAIAMFDSSPCNVELLVYPMQELLDYHSFCKECCWEEEYEKIRNQAMRLIQRQIEVIMREEEARSHSNLLVVPNGEAGRTWLWSELSPLDWPTIFGSITLLSYDKYFCEGFGQEKMMLEQRLTRLQAFDYPSLLIDQVFTCPGTSCPDTLDFNRRCRRCKVFAWPGALTGCPRKCHGKFQAPQQNDSFGRGGQNYKDCHICTVCANRFRACKEATTPFSIYCPTCWKELDFNRWCGNCSVYSCALDENKCPHCAHSSLEEGNGIEGGDWQEVRSCSRCHKRFHEVKLGTLERKYKDGKLTSVDPEFFRSVVRLEVPDSPADPNHFGHLVWKYCQFMSSVEQPRRVD